MQHMNHEWIKKWEDKNKWVEHVSEVWDVIFLFQVRYLHAIVRSDVRLQLMEDLLMPYYGIICQSALNTH